MSSKVKPTQDELMEKLIEVRRYQGDDGETYINMRDLKYGLTYRKGYVFMNGVFVSVSKLRQWLIQALKDPHAKGYSRKSRLEDWAVYEVQESTELKHGQRTYGPSVKFKLRRQGGLDAAGTFLSDVKSYYPIVHGVNWVLA